MSWKRMLTLLALLVALRADDLALVPVGAPWQWRTGRSEASTPTDAWRQVGFADESWNRGGSGFSFDATGGEYTAIPGVKDYTCLYLRRTFAVEQPETVRWLIFRVDYAGGFVAYLNGAEIARRGVAGLSGEFVPFHTVGQARVMRGPEELDVSAFASALRPGANVLAIQWHPSGTGGWGQHFVPELRANFTRGPFVQNPAPDRQHIAWRTLFPTDTVVDYGRSPALGQRVADPRLSTNHVATLTDLEADAVYYYRVASAAGDQVACSPVMTFRTFRREGAFSFTVMADVGSGNRDQHAMAGVVANTAPDLVLVAGDLVYPQYSDQLADIRFFSVYEPHMRQCPYFAVAGNHDYNYGVPAHFYDGFVMPTNSVPAAGHLAAGTDPESYYSFDQGDGHFVGLFVPLMDARTALTNGSPQLRWLEADLAASTKPWKFIFLHLPLRSSNVHRHDDYNGNGVGDQVELSALLLPLARQYGVQMIFSGHDHGYERFNPIQGVYLVVSAAAGGRLYLLNELDPASAVFALRQNCVNVRVDGDTLEYRAWGSDGTVFDQMFIQRVPPPVPPVQAAWNSPVVEAAPANDGDGNRSGQQFDFVGPSLPTAPGDFSNLGRVYVNCDHDFLYLGFEAVMIPPDANLFLFLETPGLPGVNALAGLGNGIVDPAGQGADGLDFLENLAFRNFSPAVACVLGDEYADRQARSFLRTNAIPAGQWPERPTPAPLLALDIGQGVFYLDSQFSDVPGARFQQYDVSPQLSPFPGEQNANFIEVAIPFSALKAGPGDRLRLGAVVGGAAFSTDPLEPARLLDRSFLGAHLAGAGLGPFVLEGLAVDLGPDLDPDGDGLLTEEETARGTDPHARDSDRDGLDDGWEVRWNLDPLRADGVNGADGDPDGDGFANLQEYVSGTKPRDPQSVLRLQISRTTGARLRFTWPAKVGAPYRIEFAESLAVPFQPLLAPGLPLIAAETELTFETDLPVAAPGRLRFYRLVVEP